ncbi:MAG: CHAT domain-containing protein [Cyanothece sp. SIO1E1]|nr:CHAT domain-containing protein [Cyanothece sp. SIO1E1]
MRLIAPWLRLIIISVLSVIITVGVHTLPPVAAGQVSAQMQKSGSALVQLGKAHYTDGQFLLALQHLQQAVKAYEVQAQPFNQVQALNLVSLTLQKLGRWEAAQIAIDRSLALLESWPDDAAAGLSLLQAKVLNTQGHLQLSTGKTEAALVTWQAAEKSYAQAEDANGIIGSQINQAQAMQSLGLHRQARETLDQVEQMLWAQTDSPVKVAGLLTLGNVLRLQGELNRSRSVLVESWAIAQPFYQPQGKSQILISLGNTERTLAKREAGLNQVDKNQELIQAALAHYQAAADMATLPITQTQAQLNQLSLLIDTAQLDCAQTLWSQIEQELPELPASRASVYAQVNLVRSLIKLESGAEAPSIPSVTSSAHGHISSTTYQSAVQRLNTAVQQAQTLVDKRAESYALGALGELHATVETWSQAKNSTLRALGLAQSINAPDLAYQWQWQMGRILQQETEQETQTQQANAQAIIYYTEAFNTLNSLRSDLVTLNPDIQFSFRESVEPVYRQLVDLLLRPSAPAVAQNHQQFRQQVLPPSSNQAKTLRLNQDQVSQANLTQARRVIEALQLAELDNFFRDACAQPDPTNIDDVDPNTAVIYPIILADRLEVILKLPGKNRFRHSVKHGIDEAQVDAAVNTLFSILTRRSSTLGAVKSASTQLYDWLIKPFEADLDIATDRSRSQIQTLAFVLDGAFRNVPMAALHNGEQYLVERYAIAVTPGLQLLGPKPLKQAQLNVLMAGLTDAPSFKSEGFAPLDNVALELAGISETVTEKKVLEEQAFLRSHIQQQINSIPFNVVHFATHGNFSSDPEQTFILDWQGRIQVEDVDSLLQGRDLTQDDPVELLVLSACETAAGDQRAALGLAGVAIRAGARSTLATLWHVNDESTAEFMIQFYQQFQNSQLTKAEALRNAQLAFLQDYPISDYNRPFLWAPFILVGNWL